MPRKLLIEELHVQFFVRNHLPAQETARIRRSLRSRTFNKRLWEATSNVLGQFATLKSMTFTISR